jgi:hypothetical protein
MAPTYGALAKRACGTIESKDQEPLGCGQAVDHGSDVQQRHAALTNGAVTQHHETGQFKQHLNCPPVARTVQNGHHAGVRAGIFDTPSSFVVVPENESPETSDGPM